MNEQKRRLLLIILNRLRITHRYKQIGAYEIYFCRYNEITFTISAYGESVTMSKYLGVYSIDQQNRILSFAKSVQEKGYNLRIDDDNSEKHVEMGCLNTDKQQLFFGVCCFLQIITGGKFLQLKLMAA